MSAVSTSAISICLCVYLESGRMHLPLAVPCVLQQQCLAKGGCAMLAFRKMVCLERLRPLREEKMLRPSRAQHAQRTCRRAASGCRGGCGWSGSAGIEGASGEQISSWRRTLACYKKVATATRTRINTNKPCSKPRQKHLTALMPSSAWRSIASACDQSPRYSSGASCEGYLQSATMRGLLVC